MLSVLWFKRVAGISFGQGPQSSSRVKQKKGMEEKGRKQREAKYIFR